MHSRVQGPVAISIRKIGQRTLRQFRKAKDKHLFEAHKFEFGGQETPVFQTEAIFFKSS